MKPSDIKVGLRVKGINKNFLSSSQLTPATINKITDGRIFSVKFDNGGTGAWYCDTGAAWFEIYVPDDMS